MTKPRKVGPRGFTRTEEVCAILDSLERASLAQEIDPDADEEFRASLVHDLALYQDWREESGDEVIPFEGLTAEGASRLLALMPPRQWLLRKNGAPSFLELVSLGERFPALRFHGYRVPAARADEAIVLEGFDVPVEQSSAVLAAVLDLPQVWWEVCYEDRPFLHAQWGRAETIAQRAWADDVAG